MPIVWAVRMSANAEKCTAGSQNGFSWYTTGSPEWSKTPAKPRLAFCHLGPGDCHRTGVPAGEFDISSAVARGRLQGRYSAYRRAQKPQMCTITAGAVVRAKCSYRPVPNNQFLPEANSACLRREDEPTPSGLAYSAKRSQPAFGKCQSRHQHVG